LERYGVEEAKSAGHQLKEKGFELDVIYISALKKSIISFNDLANVLDCIHYY
jgi:bisphosphoglycerate-dependent phosphoglycerate mutase